MNLSTKYSPGYWRILLYIIVYPFKSKLKLNLFGYTYSKLKTYMPVSITFDDIPIIIT